MSSAHGGVLDDALARCRTPEGPPHWREAAPRYRSSLDVLAFCQKIEPAALPRVPVARRWSSYT